MVTGRRTINGSTVSLDPFKNGFNMNNEIAAASYRDVTYVVDQSFMLKGGQIRVKCRRLSPAF